MNGKYCIWCKHCNTERKNDLNEVRCEKFSTFVKPLFFCVYFCNKSEELLSQLFNESE